MAAVSTVPFLLGLLIGLFIGMGFAMWYIKNKLNQVTKDPMKLAQKMLMDMDPGSRGNKEGEEDADK